LVPRLFSTAMDRPLYSERAGRERTLSKVDFAELVWTGITEARAKGLFAEAFDGYVDVGGHRVAPRILDEEGYFLRALKKSGVATREQVLGGAPIALVSGDVLLDFVEVLHAECVSAPARREHDGGGGGPIIRGPFDQAAGQQLFRDKMNPHLRLHTPPLQLLPDGQIVEPPSDELLPLVVEQIHDDVEPEIRDPLEAGIAQFLRRGATAQDRRAAVKHLADVLERLDSEIKRELLPADEAALFHIANKFGLRHNNREQRIDCDKHVWLEWIFYVYLATARAMLRVRDAQSDGDKTSEDAAGV
jgi:hypothetical protein